MNRAELIHAGVPAANAPAAEFNWQAADILVILLVPSYLYSIDSVLFLSVAPYIPLSFLLLLVLSKEYWKFSSKLWAVGALQILALYFGASFVQGLIVGNTSSLLKVGHLAGNICIILGLAVYSLSHEKRLRRLVLTVLIAMMVCITWFLLELFAGDPFRSIRMELYYNVYSGKLAQMEIDTQSWPSIITQRASGLRPHLHLLGYIIGALSAFLLTFRTSGSSKRINWIVWIGLLISGIGLFYSNQRAGLLGIALVLGINAMIGRMKPFKTGLVFLILMVIWFPFYEAGITLSTISGQEAWQTLSDKLQSSESSQSALRWRLQLRAIELVLHHPLGLAVEDLTWEDEGYDVVYHDLVSSGYKLRYSPIAVHNGYLGDAIQLGVLSLVLALLLLFLTIRTAWKLLMWRPTDNPELSGMARSVAMAVIVTFVPQALTHNASILNHEVASTLFFSLMLAFEVLRREDMFSESPWLGTLQRRYGHH